MCFFAENYNHRIVMCQTVLISNQIVRLGTRSYKQRLEAVNPDEYRISQLSRLNRDLDDFYELLYSQWNTVTEQDYKIFGPQLQIMLATLKDLFIACKKMKHGANFERETEKLGMNYSAIFEVNSDIVNFRINAPKDSELQNLLQQASNLTSNINS